MEALNWSQNDYLLFLSLYIANSDAQITEDERDIIQGYFGADAYKSMRKYADSCSDFECIGIITDLREKFFPGEEGKKLLLQRMKEIENADGDFNAIEHIIVRNIQKLI